MHFELDVDDCHPVNRPRAKITRVIQLYTPGLQKRLGLFSTTWRDEPQRRRCETRYCEDASGLEARDPSHGPVQLPYINGGSPPIFPLSPAGPSEGTACISLTPGDRLAPFVCSLLDRVCSLVDRVCSMVDQLLRKRKVLMGSALYNWGYQS